MENRKIRVLVLDDEPWNLRWLRYYLAEVEKIELRMTTTFDDAVKAAKENLPDIAIVDIMLGVVDSPPIGVTLNSIPEEWVGVRFLSQLRGELGAKKGNTEILVYTVLDRDDLAQIVTNSFQAVFCTKGDPEYLKARLGEFIKAFREKFASK